MAYRAHVTIHENGQRVGRKRVEQVAERMGFTYVGTRQGTPGIWIERDTKSGFETAIARIADKAEDQGVVIRIWTTNAPSQRVAEPIWYSRYTATGGRRYPAIVTVQRG